MQRIQNMSAKLILNIQDRKASVTQAHKILHWLPIKERIEFKVLTLIHKCLHKEVPDYLMKLITVRQLDYGLRSYSGNTLEIPYVKKTRSAWRAFDVCGP